MKLSIFGLFSPSPFFEDKNDAASSLQADKDKLEAERTTGGLFFISMGFHGGFHGIYDGLMGSNGILWDLMDFMGFYEIIIGVKPL